MDFPRLRLARSCALSLSNDPSYVLHFAVQKLCKSEDDLLFAAAVAGTNEIKVYNKDTFCSQCSLTGHSAVITYIKFDNLRENIIWSTSLDGTLRYWDVREPRENGTIVSTLSNVGYLSMDICCDGSILAVGTEKNQHLELPVATVEFWDIRKVPESHPKCLAKFEDIHSDDVTKILFHPDNSKIVATGSTDGLISILDLTTYDEDDALLQTLNTESSVSTMGFFGPSYEFVYTLTHIETLQLWKYHEGDLLSSLTDLRFKSPKSNPIDYVIDCIYHNPSQRLFVVGGTHRGTLEVFHINLDVIEAYLTLSGGHSSTIRCMSFHPKCLLTGGEDGMVCAWMTSLEQPSKKKQGRAQSGKEKHRGKPYSIKTKVDAT